MNSKILLLSIAVISVGLFAMPSTLSLFAGQHTFYAGADVKCEKCHLDTYNELATGLGTAHTNANLTKCEGCHKTNTSSLNATLIPSNGTANASTWAGTNVTGNANAHAAVTMECVACHTGVPAELNGTSEAHTAFYLASNYTTGNQTTIKLKGSNTACIGCHTHAIVNITWTRAIGYNMTVNSTGSGWNIVSFSMNYTQNVTTGSAGS